jgi:streptomycin 3"-adenylyltransferase
VAVTPQRPNLPIEVEEYLRAFAVRVVNVLGQELMGVYLHGSGALGGFNPARSDIDILIVCFHPLTQNQRTRLCQELGGVSLPVPASTLEMSVVTSDTCRSPVASPLYELHLNTRDNRCVDGSGRTDPDLLLHFAVAQQSGRLIGSGRFPKDVFGPVPRNLVLEGMAMELEDALSSSNAAPEYAVLNACRNLAYDKTGHIYSKIDGAEWVLAHEPTNYTALIRAVIHRQEQGTGADEQIDPKSVAAFVTDVVSKLRRCES